MKSEIEFEIKKNMTDAICSSGANLAQINRLMKKRYVPKKEMKEALEEQLRFLKMIQKSKDEILLKLKYL